MKLKLKSLNKTHKEINRMKTGERNCLQVTTPLSNGI